MAELTMLMGAGIGHARAALRAPRSGCRDTHTLGMDLGADDLCALRAGARYL